YSRNRFRATLNSPPVAPQLTYTATDEQTTACGSCIIIMVAMRLEKLRQVDLNLLITFAAIAEEKSITAAASRLLLSQPAVSRALQRARAMFQDEVAHIQQGPFSVLEFLSTNLQAYRGLVALRRRPEFYE